MWGSDMPDMESWFRTGSMRSGRGPSVRRGEVRDAILAVLSRQPMHGYRIMQALADESGGHWRPSAGSVYPTLQQLEDEGLVTGEETDGKRVFSLTEAGQAAAAEAAATQASQGTEPPAGAKSQARPTSPTAIPDELRDALIKLNGAVAQAGQTCSPETLAKLRTVLVDARKAIYRLLAEEDEPDQSHPEDQQEVAK